MYKPKTQIEYQHVTLHYSNDVATGPTGTIAKLRAIPLEAVLRASEATPDKCDKHKWNSPMGVFSITGAKFINWNYNLGGGGAIDLVMHLNNFGFKEALRWLKEHFPDSTTKQTKPLLFPNEKTLTLPLPDPEKLWLVKNYLTQKRAIPKALLEPLIQAGTLYADQRANAVFLLLGKEKSPVGAELRSTKTTRSWHGMAAGSKKNLGFFYISPPTHAQGFILCESAIDAISCFAFYPQHCCISTTGARSNPAWLPALLTRGLQLHCGFDSDHTGNTIAAQMTALYPTVKRLTPSLHDWNDILCQSV